MDLKSVFATNLKSYMAAADKTRMDLSRDLGVSYFTVSDWVNAKKYPRMDTVDRIAAYFGVTKADLVEEKLSPEEDAKQDFLVDVLLRLQTDEEFFSYIEEIMGLDPVKIRALKHVLKNLNAFAQ